MERKKKGKLRKLNVIQAQYTQLHNCENCTHHACSHNLQSVASPLCTDKHLHVGGLLSFSCLSLKKQVGCSVVALVAIMLKFRNWSVLLIVLHLSICPVNIYKGKCQGGNYKTQGLKYLFLTLPNSDSGCECTRNM